jgi:class 3 adenylate cyclase
MVVNGRTTMKSDLLSQASLHPDLRRKLREMDMSAAKSRDLKVVSVLFVEIKNFSSLFLRHDAETVFEIADIFYRVLHSAITSHDGIVSQVHEGNLVALWGLPEWKNNDASQAVRAAVHIRMEMFHLIPELVRVGTVPLEIGMGVVTGGVVLGFIGPLQRKELALIGGSISFGERLRSIAADNRILIDKRTALHVKDLSYLLRLQPDVIEKELNGIKAFEVEGIYQYNPKPESQRKYPRFIVAKVGALTNLTSKKRKVGLIKSISEGGLGIEIHENKGFNLNIGEKALIDCKRLKLLGMDQVKGLVMRKENHKSAGIFHLKTWDMGFKLLELTDKAKRNLHKVATKGG